MRDPRYSDLWWTCMLLVCIVGAFVLGQVL